MLEPKFKIGDVVYYYIHEGYHYGLYHEGYHYGLYKDFIKSITISTCDIVYAMDDSIGEPRSINEIDLFLDLDLCKAVHIAKKIKMLRDKIEQVPFLSAEIQLKDYTEFTISKEEQAHNK